MSFAALIPFFILLICFVGLKRPLTTSAFLGLLCSCVLTQTLFHATDEVWKLSLLRTGEFTFEIGLILFGAFFFLEVARKVGVIESLAKLIKEVSSNRVVQGVLVTFPLELMVEGSSGFGTPLLVIAPILMALGFEISLCAILPFINFIIGIPFGALGTPIRLGFQTSDPSHGTVIALLPFVLIAPLTTQYLISKELRLKESFWITMLGVFYYVLAFQVSRAGPEFSALAPAFLTFIFALVSARVLFKSEATQTIKEKKGILVYGLLIIFLWIGKQVFMDRLIPDTHVRLFNPGYIFLIFGLLLMAFYHRSKPGLILRSTFDRSKRTLIVFFCMTFIVQQMRNNGALTLLTASIPEFFLNGGAPLLAWLGTMLIGTSTLTNLLLSKVLAPDFYIALSTGSAIGVQLAFQSLAAMRSTIHDQLSEKEIFFKIAPISFGFILILTFWIWLTV